MLRLRCFLFLRLRICFLLGSCAAVCMQAVAAEQYPPIVIGGGDPTTCTDTAIAGALAVAEQTGGGTLRFSRGREPVTIALPTAFYDVDGMAVVFLLPTNSTVDGGGLVTLDVQVAARGFWVAADATAELSNLAFTSRAWSAVHNLGALSIKGCTFFDGL